MIFPTKFINAQSVSITSQTRTEVTRYGDVVQVGKRGNPHHWKIDFKTPPKSHDESLELSAFINSLDGQYTPFTMNYPLAWSSVDDSATMKTSSYAGENTLNLKDLTPNTTDAIKAGSFISFDNHDKVYQLVTAANSNASGEATITIYPRLFANATTNTVLNKATFKLRLLKDKHLLTLDAKKPFSATTIAAIEAH